MNWIKTKWKQFDVSPKTIRQFGLILSGLLFVFGILANVHNHPHWKIEWPLATMVLALTFFVPRWLSYLYRVWMILAEQISWVVLRILLAVILYLIISPMSLFLRLRGKDVLDQNIDSSRSSYWKKREPKAGVNHYERLF